MKEHSTITNYKIHKLETFDNLQNKQTYLHVKVLLYVFKTSRKNKSKLELYSKVDFLNSKNGKKNVQEIESFAKFGQPISSTYIRYFSERHEVNDTKQAVLWNEYFSGPKLLVSIAINERTMLSMKDSLIIDLTLNSYFGQVKKLHLGSVKFSLNDPMSENKILILPIHAIPRRNSKIKRVLNVLSLNSSMLKCKKKHKDVFRFFFADDCSEVYELCPNSSIEARVQLERTNSDSLNNENPKILQLIPSVETSASDTTHSTASFNLLCSSFDSKDVKIYTKDQYSSISGDEDTSISSYPSECHRKFISQTIIRTEDYSYHDRFETAFMSSYTSDLTEESSTVTSSFEEYKNSRRKKSHI